MATDLRGRLKSTPPRLRNFGLAVAAVVLLAFAVIVPWLTEHPAPLWPWPIALSLTLAALLRPALLTPAYRGTNWLALRLNWFNTRLLLTLTWLLIIVPTGVLLKIFSRSATTWHGGPPTGSNRRWRNQPIKPEDMDRPF